MSDTATVTTGPAAGQTAAQTANNIVNAITNKASGKAPASQSPINDQKAPVNSAAVDPNAGKEKYVVDGKEVWLTPQERTIWIQKGMAFEPRMDQLARLQQESMQLQRALLNDPGTVLSNLAKQRNVPMKDLVQRILHGNSSDEIKETVGHWYYETAVEPLQMTPEQLKAREDSKWRQQREEQDKLNQENMVRADNHRKFVAAMGHLKAQIGEAMKESGLPDNNTPLGIEMAAMVAKVMQLADKRRQPLTPKQAIDIVKRHRIQAVQSSYYESLADQDDDGEALSKELGDKIVGKIQKFLLRKAKAAGAPPPIVPNGTPRGRNGERKTINQDEFHEYLDEIKRKG